MPTETKTQRYELSSVSNHVVLHDELPHYIAHADARYTGHAAELVARANAHDQLKAERDELMDALRTLTDAVEIGTLKLTVRKHFHLLNAKACADKLLHRLEADQP